MHWSETQGRIPVLVLMSKPHSRPSNQRRPKTHPPLYRASPKPGSFCDRGLLPRLNVYPRGVHGEAKIGYQKVLGFESVSSFQHPCINHKMPTAQGIRCQVFACTTKNPHNRVIKHSDDLLSEYTCPADSSKLREGVAPPSLLPAPPQHEYHSYVNLTQAGDRPLYIEVDPTTFDWGDCTSLMAEFYMDGVKIGKGKTFHSSISWMSNPNKVISFYRTSFIKRVYGEQDQEVTAELRFGNLKHDDESDDTPKPVRDDTNMLGEITVKIYRFSGGQCERRQRRLPKNLPMLPSQANITERDVKGKGISHLINLGDIQTSTYKFRDHGSGSRSYHLARTQPKDINRPFLTFIFKYRTQEHLECLGLISKPPQPSNDVPVRVGRPVKIEDTTQKTENTEQKVKNDKCDDTQVAESGQTKSGPATQSGVKRKSTGTGHTCDGEPSQKTVKMDGPGSSAENPIILKLEGPGSSAKYPIVFKMEGQGSSTVDPIMID